MPPKEYRGRLSTGCEPCRARRVKCDESKPICSKCVKARVGDQCRYRNLVDISFRNESSNAAERTRKTWRARAKHGAGAGQTRSDDDGSDGSGASTRQASPSSYASSLVSTSTPEPLLALDVTTCAMNRFFYDFMLPSTRGQPGRTGVFDYVPHLLSKTGPDTPLRHAVYAVALANYSRRAPYSLPQSSAQIVRHYGNALTLVKRETQRPGLVATDELVLAVHMLGIYEQMSSGGNNYALLEAHAHGLAALLRLRSLPSLAKGFEFRLFQSINTQMLTACLARGLPSFISYSYVKDMYESSPYPMFQMTGFAHRAADLLALWRGRNELYVGTDEAEELAMLDQFSTLSMNLFIWEMTVHDCARFASYPTPPASTQPKWIRPILEHPGMPQFSHRYSMYLTIILWNMGRSAWILVEQVLVEASVKMPGSDPAQHIENIWRLIEDMCSSVLAIFTDPIEGKPHAENAHDVCGFRSQMVLGPLAIARSALARLPQTAEMVGRAAWMDFTVKFVRDEFHKGRPA